MAGPIGQPPAPTPVETRTGAAAGAAAGAMVGAALGGPVGAAAGATAGAVAGSAHARDAVRVARTGTAPVLSLVEEAKTAGRVFSEGYRQGVNEERAKVSQMSDAQRAAYFARAMIHSPGISGGIRAVVNHYFGN